jgi:hypothetical protein
MKFEKKHLDGIDNLFKILQKAQLPGIAGVEMLAFAQAYYLLLDVKKIIELQMQQPQVQAPIKQSQIIPQSSSNNVISEQISDDKLKIEHTEEKSSKVKRSNK